MNLPFGPIQGNGEAPAGNATAADVLSGPTFGSAAAGAGAVGAMPNYGEATFTPGPVGQSGAAGYYSAVTVKNIPAQHGSIILTGSGSWNLPDGVTSFVFILIGPGGGGGGGSGGATAPNTQAGWGGGSGGNGAVLIGSANGLGANAAIQVSVGAGGQGGDPGTVNMNGSSGTAGGNTSITLVAAGQMFAANGGEGGAGGATEVNGGAPGGGGAGGGIGSSPIATFGLVGLAGNYASDSTGGIQSPLMSEAFYHYLDGFGRGGVGGNGGPFGGEGTYGSVGEPGVVIFIY